MIRSRFQQEISGELGSYWQKSAEAELLEIKEEIDNGLMTIDEYGVVRNRIGRVVMADMLEKVMYVAADRVNEEATKAARAIEVSKAIEEYRANYKGPSQEELGEMRAAFGEGARVVNIFTGQCITV